MKSKYVTKNKIEKLALSWIPIFPNFIIHHIISGVNKRSKQIINLYFKLKILQKLNSLDFFPSIEGIQLLLT